MKLGTRLAHLVSLVKPDYPQIWDCCCDHGLLGATLLKQYPQSQVHFVDIVPELIAALETKLKHFMANANWQVHCQDVGHLPLAHYVGPQLVIIAGVGGELCARFVSALQQRFANLPVDFLLCPVRDQFLLRAALQQLPLSLLHEGLVSENRRCYEVLYVSNWRNSGQAISATGDTLWQCHNDAERKIAQQYLQNTLRHYQQARLSQPELQAVVDAYQQVTLR
ncbi:tRNA (adenine(22)-N(1))-methyltransferase TrmK [Pseudoalteromonas fenneropenaei]|uniref:tRNA (Adenine(22)-N(1))-methyltransferase TrmK n=1 Tax=Pseudoalteromonas fenneropenaei TaxID=1737459 RepID=A0ABV7CGN9_9GAMM